MPRIHLLLRLLFLLVLLPAQVALASVTAGAIKGTTLDDSGLPIPGVLVTITSDSMMGPRQAQTDVEGRFQFVELPPGVYELVAESPGFAKVRQPGLQVNIGRNTQVTVEMPLEEAGLEIVVEERRPNIDTEQVSRSTVLSREFLERIPSGRSYQEATQMSAGTTGGGNPNIGGAGFNENTYLLDGINITDPVTGTFSLNFNFDAIEQIEVLTGAYDPEYGVNLGGSVNIVTRSGSNTMEFITDVRYTNGNWSPKLDSRFTAYGSEVAPTDFDSQFEILTISALLSGPIIRDKAWFVMSYQHDRSLIANVGIDLPRDYEGHYVYSKLTFQPSAAHRFTLLTQSDPTTIDNLNQSDRFVEPEAQYRQAQGGWILSGQWDWFISTDMFLESKNTIQKSFIELSQVPCTHDKTLGYNPCGEDEVSNSIDYDTPGRAGLNQAYDRDNIGFAMFDDRYIASTQNKFSLLQVEFLGTHDIKTGFELDARWRSYLWTYAGNMYFYDWNREAYNPDTLENYYWVEYTGPIIFKTTATHFGAFLQDVYKPRSNLTIRYGARFDRSLFFNDVGERVIDVGLWGPRFAVSWDPWSNNKTKFVGSVGRFNDTGRFGVVNFLTRADLGIKLYLGEIGNFYTNEASQDYYYIPVEPTQSILDGTIAPHSDEVLLGAERELFADIVGQLYFTGKFTRNIYEYDETNYYWDEDGYNVVGTGDGSVTAYERLRTPNIARRDYYRADVGLQRNFVDRWLVQGVYSYTVSHGTTQTALSGVLVVPEQVQYYVDSVLPTEVKHDVALAAAWDLPGTDPWTTQVGMSFFLESGNPESRYYESGVSGILGGGGSMLKDTAGTYAVEDPWWELSMRLSQAIPVRKGKLSGVAEVSNLTNNRSGTGAGVDSATNRWVISSRQSPMQITLGGRYEF